VPGSTIHSSSVARRSGGLVGGNAAKCCQVSGMQSICTSGADDDGVVISGGDFGPLLALSRTSAQDATQQRAAASRRVGGVPGLGFRVHLTKTQPEQDVKSNEQSPYVYAAKFALQQYNADPTRANADKVVRMSAAVSYTFPGRCTLTQLVSYLGGGLDFNNCSQAPVSPPATGSLGPFEYCAMQPHSADGASTGYAWIAVRTGDRYFELALLDKSTSRFMAMVNLWESCDLKPGDAMRWSAAEFNLFADPDTGKYRVRVSINECSGDGVGSTTCKVSSLFLDL
jgi:hypothetical protein